MGATGCPICICKQHLGSLAHFQMIGTIMYIERKSTPLITSNIRKNTINHILGVTCYIIIVGSKGTGQSKQPSSIH